MRRCNIAIAGFGAVGRAIADMTVNRRDRYRERYGCDVRLTGIRRSRSETVDLEGLDIARFGRPPGAAKSLSDDFIAAADAHVLIEATPSDFRSGGPGLPYMRAALEKGRHVIAVSKGALVHDGLSLKALAAEHGAQIKVSAACGAALPAFDLLDHSLKGCAIVKIEGILNATSNHLLSAMMEKDLSLSEALSAAQRAGIAEADPSLDIDGWDTASKILILANFALGAQLSIDDIAVTGIRHIDATDIASWRKASLAPKLIGRLTHEDGTLRADVAVRTYAARDPFASVRDETKAICVTTDLMGEIFASGCGSKPQATAAAALKDLEHILGNAG